jgi:hypothetical protein
MKTSLRGNVTGMWPSHQRDDMISTSAGLNVTLSASVPFLSFPMLLYRRVVRICGVVWFLERFCHREMDWTQENVIEFIELYKRKVII